MYHTLNCEIFPMGGLKYEGLTGHPRTKSKGITLYRLSEDDKYVFLCNVHGTRIRIPKDSSDPIFPLWDEIAKGGEKPCADIANRKECI